MEKINKKKVDLFSKSYLLLFVFLFTPASGDCPTECYCPEETAICIGDGQLKALPLLHVKGQRLLRRLEMRDYILNDLLIQESLFIGNIEELILSHNQIKSIGSERKPMETEDSVDSTTFCLKVLDLSNNNLTEFSSLRQMLNLKTLDLSHNSIEILSVEWLGKLESLNLRSNSIQDLKEGSFDSLKSLHYINLERNRLQVINSNLFSNLPLLSHLILSMNPLNLPRGFLFNSRAQFLDISEIGLSRVPTSLNPTVRDLRLNGNRLSTITKTDFESYSNLGILVFDGNKIEKIEDDALGRLEFLTGLWINKNRLSRIPQNLPSSLKSLHLEENNIISLKESDFLSLRNLETLSLRGNVLTSLEPFIFSSLTRLRTLILRANEIDSLLLQSFRNLSALETLDLSENPIKVLVSGALSPLVHLSLLHFSRLEEKEIQLDPSGLFSSLKKLEVLDLSNSPFFTRELLPGLGELIAIKEINLEACDLELRDIRVLCEEIMELESLRVIKLARNPFHKATSGPEFISSMYSLAKLCPGNESGNINTSRTYLNSKYTRISETATPSNTTSSVDLSKVSLTNTSSLASTVKRRSSISNGTHLEPTKFPSTYTLQPLLKKMTSREPMDLSTSTSSYYGVVLAPRRRQKTNEDPKEEDQDEEGSIRNRNLPTQTHVRKHSTFSPFLHKTFSKSPTNNIPSLNSDRNTIDKNTSFEKESTS